MAVNEVSEYFLDFKAQSAFYEIEMKQKQNRNLMIETLKGG